MAEEEELFPDFSLSSLMFFTEPDLFLSPGAIASRIPRIFDFDFCRTIGTGGDLSADEDVDDDEELGSAGLEEDW